MTERGTFFGYGDLIVDMRSFSRIRGACECPVVFDGTHSVQRPGIQSGSSGGDPGLIPQLVRAAAEMNALIYPVFLRSGERFGRGWSRKGRLHMGQLAEASGGKLFPALSIRDLEPVFPQVSRELRSVYGVAYYPENQNFDGVWRSLQVKVKRPGVTVRARTGYFAR